MNKIYVIFNNETRLCMFILPDDALIRMNPNLLYKEIDLDESEFNLSRYKWEGTYDNGKIVDTFINNTAVVTEEEVDAKYREFLLRKYPLDRILCKIVLNMDFSETDEEFNGMKKFIGNLDNKRAKEIDFYQKSPVHKFETWDDIFNREKQLFKTLQ